MAGEMEPSDAFGEILDHFFSSRRPIFSLSNRLWNPPTDIYECSDQIVIKMEVAGLAPESLGITAHERRLIVRGRRFEERGDAIVTYHLMEVRYGEFERIFEFPFRLSMDEIKASYEKGFLCIEVPKRAPISVKVPIRVIEERGG